jgi:hypothetical protein
MADEDLRHAHAPLKKTLFGYLFAIPKNRGSAGVKSQQSTLSSLPSMQEPHCNPRDHARAAPSISQKMKSARV